MEITRRGFMTGLSAAVAMDWAPGLADSVQKPFGAGSSVLDPRIKRLLERERAGDIFPGPVPVAYDPADEALPEPVRIGKRLKEYISAQPVAIREDEELCGWLAFDGSVESDFYRRTGHEHFWNDCFSPLYLKPRENLAIFEWQHGCLDYPKIVREGFEGFRRDIEASKTRWQGDRERLDYLRGMELALDGLEARAANAAGECRRLAADEPDGKRRETLLEMAERLDRVPARGARTFDEAVQSVFFCYDCMSDAIGRLDQYLAPYYFADIAAGRTTRDRAAARLQELFIFIDAHTPHASSNRDKGGECHMTVGGLTPDGRDGWTDFSRLVVESRMACNLIRPELSFRWHSGTGRETLRFMLDCERRDPNRSIAFDGDTRRVEAMLSRLGLPAETARDYCITGCNEIVFMGGVSYGGFHANACRCLDRIFGQKRAEAAAAATWEDFKSLFEREFHADLARMDEISNEYNEIRSRDCNVLSAIFLAGCIERADGPTRRGATLRGPCIDLLGMANLIDSLCSVRQFVYEEKRCTMDELADALDADWKGHEDLRSAIRREAFFFGDNRPLSNETARFVHESLARFAEGRRDWFGSPLLFGNHTGYNDNAVKFGRLTRATPDGRFAGEALSHCGNPAAGHDTDATSALLASAQMDPQDIMCGTSVFNLHLQESYVRDDSVFEKVVALVETYFRLGGLHLQLNYFSRETLLAAQRDPEKYKDLRVRISGFSGYFVRFKKTIQDEVIARSATPA